MLDFTLVKRESLKMLNPSEQCNIRVRRYGGINVPYGMGAPYRSVDK